MRVCTLVIKLETKTTRWKYIAERQRNLIWPSFPYHREQHPTTLGGRRGYPARRENQLVCHDVSDLCVYACNFLRILPRYPRQSKGPTSLQLYIYLDIIISFKPLEVPGFR